MEEKKEVKVFKVDFKCPNCETGYLRPTDTVYTTMPPMYPHRCNNKYKTCGYSQTFNETYPQIIYVDVDEKEV